MESKKMVSKRDTDTLSILTAMSTMDNSKMTGFMEKASTRKQTLEEFIEHFMKIMMKKKF
jgi:hypothetical protein